MALSLAGKHCAVVGATGVIGSHIAQALAGRGAVVSLLGRSVLEARPKLQAQLTPYAPPPQGQHSGDSPAEHRFIRLDVSSRESIRDVFRSKPPAQVRWSCRVILMSWLFVYAHGENVMSLSLAFNTDKTLLGRVTSNGCRSSGYTRQLCRHIPDHSPQDHP